MIQFIREIPRLEIRGERTPWELFRLACELFVLLMNMKVYTSLSLSLSLSLRLYRANRVQHDTYAIAAASLELGLLYIETGSLDEAHQILESTKCVFHCVQTTNCLK